MVLLRASTQLHWILHFVQNDNRYYFNDSSYALSVPPLLALLTSLR